MVFASCFFRPRHSPRHVMKAECGAERGRKMGKLAKTATPAQSGVAVSHRKEPTIRPQSS